MKKTKKPSRPKTIHKKVRRHVKMAVVPHRANQFRPHLIRRHGIAALLVVVVVTLFGSNWVSTGSVLGERADITAASLLAHTNVEREQRNMGALKYDKQLSEAAFLKAKDMFRQQYWAHVAPDGTTPWQWFARVGYNYAYAGENLAKNFRSTDTAMNAWMASDKHRDNILNPEYTEVGFAVVDGTLDGQQTTLIVALYGQPMSDTVVAGAEGVHVNSPPVVSTGGIMSQFGVMLQSASPAALGSAVFLLIAAVIALTAHAYRRRLPPAIRKSWRYHHGLYKATGLTALAIVLVALYSGGQI